MLWGGTEKRCARDHPEPGQQSEAQHGDGAELVAGHHGQRETEQHLVRVSGGGRQRRQRARDPEHREHGRGQYEDRIDRRHRKKDRVTGNSSTRARAVRMSFRLQQVIGFRHNRH
jgi:hypothetical protein